MKRVVKVNWYKLVNSTFRDFLERFGDKHGIYMVGDAEYKGYSTYRSMTSEGLYIGQAGGGARREKEVKTGGKYVKGSLDARYRSGSYTNIPEAAAGTMSFKNEQMGIDIERPFFFGVVGLDDRNYIRILESQIIQIYQNKATEYGYFLVNRDKSVLSEENIKFCHIGDVPVLLTTKEEENSEEDLTII